MTVVVILRNRSSVIKYVVTHDRGVQFHLEDNLDQGKNSQHKDPLGEERISRSLGFGLHNGQEPHDELGGEILDEIFPHNEQGRVGKKGAVRH